jgi:hypothetical protein
VWNNLRRWLCWKLARPADSRNASAHNPLAAANRLGWKHDPSPPQRLIRHLRLHRVRAGQGFSYKEIAGASDWPDRTAGIGSRLPRHPRPGETSGSPLSQWPHSDIEWMPPFAASTSTTRLA